LLTTELILVLFGERDIPLIVDALDARGEEILAQIIKHANV